MAQRMALGLKIVQHRHARRPGRALKLGSIDGPGEVREQGHPVADRARGRHAGAVDLGAAHDGEEVAQDRRQGRIIGVPEAARRLGPQPGSSARATRVFVPPISATRQRGASAMASSGLAYRASARAKA